MEAEFWHERWQDGRIGFHQADVNALLRAHWPTLAPLRGATNEVFVPLCGKSLDMVWLASPEGGAHHVIGVELSDIAARAFFEEQGLAYSEISAAACYTIQRQGQFDIYRHGRYEIWCGDFFAFPTERLAGTRLAYDRASLIALPPDMRQWYARKLTQSLPAEARTLLLTLTYGDGELQGPPFSVSDAEVNALFGPDRVVTLLETQGTTAGGGDPRSRSGVTATTSAFVIGPATP